MRTIASGEWVAAAAHAADRVGADAALLLRDALGDAPHHTAWSRAAMSAMDGTLAAARLTGFGEQHQLSVFRDGITDSPILPAQIAFLAFPRG